MSVSKKETNFRMPRMEGGEGGSGCFTTINPVPSESLIRGTEGRREIEREKREGEKREKERERERGENEKEEDGFNVSARF